MGVKYNRFSTLSGILTVTTVIDSHRGDTVTPRKPFWLINVWLNTDEIKNGTQCADADAEIQSHEKSVRKVITVSQVQIFE